MITRSLSPLSRRTQTRRAQGSRLLTLAVVAALSLSACGADEPANTPIPQATDASSGTGAATDGGAGSAAPLSGQVTVLAAASLTESFDKIKADFEAANPGVTVRISYGSSATLVQQVNTGAPAQVIALAGESAAEPLDKSKVISSSIFASNSLEIAVPPSNPAKVDNLDDLDEPQIKLVLCAETVPCGKAADTTFKKAGIIPVVVSRESDVKATLAKVKLGEADAAVVYHSDVVASKGTVNGVPIDKAVNTTLRYPIIALADDPATKAFVDWVTSAKGTATVQSFGLTAP